MPEVSAHLRTLAADAEALQQRLHDAVAALDGHGLTPAVAFRIGEAHALLGSAVRSLETAVAEAAAEAAS